MWPGRYGGLIAGGPDFDRPESERGLFGGDALTRAMMADALLKHGERDRILPLLAEAFAADNYPIVRFFAANGLTADHAGISKPDYLASPEMRAAQIAAWIRSLDPAQVERVRQDAEKLRRGRRDVDLEVGE